MKYAKFIQENSRMHTMAGHMNGNVVCDCYWYWRADKLRGPPVYAVFLCGFHALIGYEQMDALFSSQSLAVHQLSSTKSSRDKFVKGMLA